MATTGSPPLLRQINQARVLAALRHAGKVRLAELASRVGLSRPTVSDILDELKAAGWVTYLDEHPEGRAGLGRPARLVQFRAAAGYVVGIDIGAHRTSVMVADLEGDVVARAREPTKEAHSSREMLTVIRSTVSEALQAGGIDRQLVLSVAVGTPGIIDRRTTAVLQAPGIPGWQSVNLAAALRRSFRCPIEVENDINLAVLGECWRGVGQDARTVVFVGWGERVGAGICIDGRLHVGANAAAGEIGYLSVLDSESEDAHADESGAGPFERGIGAGTIARLGQEAAARSGGAMAAGPKSAIDAAAVFAAAGAGDPVAAGVVGRVIGRLARGLAPILLILDPDLLVIGGGVSRSGHAMLNAVAARLGELTIMPTRVELSALGEDAVAIGAVRLALTDVEQRLMPSLGDLEAGV